MRPVIALLSDFGARDHYAGTMKGVILGICPDATLVDITHDVTPHDVLDRYVDHYGRDALFPVADTPLGRLASEDDVVNVIRFLMSDQAAFVTGETILVDGGISC